MGTLSLSEGEDSDFSRMEGILLGNLPPLYLSYASKRFKTIISKGSLECDELISTDRTEITISENLVSNGSKRLLG